MTPSQPKRPPQLAIFTTDFMGGGVGRMMTELAVACAENGYAVDLVVCDDSGERGARLRQAGVRIVVLKRVSHGRARLAALARAPAAWGVLARPLLLPVKTLGTLGYLPSLARYVRSVRPQTLLAAKTECNLVAVLARGRGPSPTKIAVSERNMIGAQYQNKRRARDGAKQWGRWHKWRWRYLAPLMYELYGRADQIIAISEAVAADLAQFTGIERGRIAIAPNPVFSEAIRTQAKAAVAHPWFAPGEAPVVLYAGRLSRQKGLDTLLDAFARLPSNSARLVLLGDGTLKTELQARADRLGIADRLDWLGPVDNPFKYMARAGVFVLPSIYEGFGNVLVEAMGCGCPVIATDCPGAPAEILGGGRYGPVVAAGDANALASAITAVLAEPPAAATLVQRARCFSVARAMDRYLELTLADAPRLARSA